MDTGQLFGLLWHQLTDTQFRESVALFNYASRGQTKKADELYRWSLPLLRMDTVIKFVQLIKLVQQQTGTGNERWTDRISWFIYSEH